MFDESLTLESGKCVVNSKFKVENGHKERAIEKTLVGYIGRLREEKEHK